jgi:hypothetical protein
MPGMGGTRSRGRSVLFAGIFRAAPSPALCLPCRRSRVRIPSAALRKAPHLRGFPRSWAGPREALLGHFPRLLSLHCLNRGFLALPGGPRLRAILRPKLRRPGPRAPLAAPGDGDRQRRGAARRASCRAGVRGARPERSQKASSAVQPSTSSSCSEVLLMAGVWTEVCLAQTALSALEDGYTSTS